jgi:4-hydroxy-L-threonine phosphate dehydrogenase PdxA
MRIGITLGDPAGIGPEIILKAAPILCRYKDLAVFGNKYILRKTASDLGLTKNFRQLEPVVTDCVEKIKFTYGRPNKDTARVALGSFQKALAARPDILITAPIVKAVIKDLIPDFVGHTEYLARFFKVREYAMVGLAQDKRIMLLTTHLPLRRVWEGIRTSTISRALTLLARGLARYFAIPTPRIAVCAFNPHGFEFSLGEETMIKKGIAIAQKNGIRAYGPYPADSIFNQEFDGFLAIYHDQAMVYLKARKGGLNFTMGLPIVRLSPLHGTALDIAGKNIAVSSGIVTALRAGIRMIKNVRRYDEPDRKNP